MPGRGWTPQQARAWLEELQYRGMQLGLDRVQKLASILQEPQQAFPSVLIAGTNGKGTVAALLDSVLRRCDLRTGRYTSPHLIDWLERITVCGSPITDREFADALGAVSEGAEAVQATPFEILTMAAFWHFRRAGVERGVLEVGLGGRLDATRICRADLTAVTAIDRDHTAELGEELSAIAREKGAIARPGAPMLLGPGTEGVRSVLEDQAGAVGTEAVRAVDLVHVEGGPDGAWGMTGTAEWRGDAADVAGRSGEDPALGWRMPLAGAHMMANLTTALAALALLRAGGVRIPSSAIQQGIESVDWPGRLQPFPTPRGYPELLLDVAHNPLAVGMVMREIARRRPHRPVRAVLALATDKDLHGVLGRLLPGVEALVATSWGGPRASEPAVIAEAARRVAAEAGMRTRVETETDPVNAVAAAARDLDERGLVLATGSHMLVGALLASLEQPEERHRHRRE